MHNPGIVICSRLDSDRLPKKVCRLLNGVPVLVHLLRQLLKADIRIIVAVPRTQRESYQNMLSPYPELSGVYLFDSEHENDPLARTAQVRKFFNLSHVIRVTHDKIFVDIRTMRSVVSNPKFRDVDYLYSPMLLPGSGFEVLSAKCVIKAAEKFKNVEHISYAARIVSENTKTFLARRQDVGANLLIDFPEDLKLMEVLFASLGNDTCLSEVLNYLKWNPDLIKINKPPLVTVYTCAHNAEKFIKKAMVSVEYQSTFKSCCEYILIDDCSSDKTYELMARFAIDKPNVSWLRNEKNIGLASSCNVALKKARGRYLIRLDADDYFVYPQAIGELVERAEKTESEILYPDNYYGSTSIIQKGKKQHHAGGALFDKRALNFLKFTDNLRHYEGLDLFTRAKDKLKVGYFNKPVFFYTQHEDSMSKNNLEERAKIKSEIESRA